MFIDMDDDDPTVPANSFQRQRSVGFVVGATVCGTQDDARIRN